MSAPLAIGFAVSTWKRACADLFNAQFINGLAKPAAFHLSPYRSYVSAPVLLDQPMVVFSAFIFPAERASLKFLRHGGILPQGWRQCGQRARTESLSDADRRTVVGALRD